MPKKFIIFISLKKVTYRKIILILKLLQTVSLLSKTLLVKILLKMVKRWVYNKFLVTKLITNKIHIITIEFKANFIRQIIKVLKIKRLKFSKM